MTLFIWPEPATEFIAEVIAPEAGEPADLKPSFSVDSAGEYIGEYDADQLHCTSNKSKSRL